MDWNSPTSKSIEMLDAKTALSAIPVNDRAVVEELFDILTLCRAHKTDGEKLLGNYIVDLLAKINVDCERDDLGNIIAYIDETKSTTLFTSHLDTVHSQRENTQELVFYKEDKDLFVMSSNGSCLGADDGTGVWLMLDMIRANVPGTYAFFVGEERGRIGSEHWRKNTMLDLECFERCISFDRKGYDDVITNQMGSRCASDEFAKALLKALNFRTTKCNPQGSFTDSATFMDTIPECTNISVGYFSQHTGNEKQNVTFANRLRKRLANINFEDLPTKRSPAPRQSYTQPLTYSDPATKPLHFNQVMALLQSEPELVAAFVVDRAASLTGLENAYDRQRGFAEAKAKADRRLELFPPS